jgi:hypothetical protein
VTYSLYSSHPVATDVSYAGFCHDYLDHLLERKNPTEKHLQNPCSCSKLQNFDCLLSVRSLLAFSLE